MAGAPLYEILAKVTGLSEAELRWTAERVHHLIRIDRKTKAEAKEIVRREAKTKPWEQV